MATNRGVVRFVKPRDAEAEVLEAELEDAWYFSIGLGFWPHYFTGLA